MTQFVCFISKHQHLSDDNKIDFTHSWTESVIFVERIFVYADMQYVCRCIVSAPFELLLNFP